MSIIRRSLVAFCVALLLLSISISAGGCGSAGLSARPGSAPTAEEKAKLQAQGKSDPSQK